VSLDPKTNQDLWALPLTGERKPFPVVQTNFVERNGQFSPDGRWVAYTSTESGQSQVYVQPFPKASGKWQISVDGGSQPRWQSDGKQIFYLGRENQMMAASIRIAPNGQGVEPDTPVQLFTTRMPLGGGLQAATTKQQYVVSSDGQRFLIRSAPQQESGSVPITVLLNWKGN
jgi:Tol biopolymer transport system component